MWQNMKITPVKVSVHGVTELVVWLKELKERSSQPWSSTQLNLKGVHLLTSESLVLFY